MVLEMCKRCGKRYAIEGEQFCEECMRSEIPKDETENDIEDIMKEEE